MPLKDDSTYLDLINHNLKIMIQEGKLDDKEFISADPNGGGKQLEIMMMILNDNDYLPAFLTVMSFIVGMSSDMLLEMVKQAADSRLKLLLAKTLGSSLELR